MKPAQNTRKSREPNAATGDTRVRIATGGAATAGWVTLAARWPRHGRGVIAFLREAVPVFASLLPRYEPAGAAVPRVATRNDVVRAAHRADLPRAREPRVVAEIVPGEESLHRVLALDAGERVGEEHELAVGGVARGLIAAEIVEGVVVVVVDVLGRGRPQQPLRHVDVREHPLERTHVDVGEERPERAPAELIERDRAAAHRPG